MKSAWIILCVVALGANADDQKYLGHCQSQEGASTALEEDAFATNLLQHSIGLTAMHPGPACPVIQREDKVPSMIELRHRAHVAEQLLKMAGLSTKPSDADSVIRQLEDTINSAGQVINEGHTVNEGMAKTQTDQYDLWASDAAVKTVCETGFNAGHSAARFLSDGNAHVYEFDIGDHDYSHTAERFLTSKFQDRLKVTWGDSTKTLLQFHAQHPDIKCDLVIVDGGHDVQIADADLRNFAPMAASKHLVAIDDTPCKAHYCAGPTSAWKNLVQLGCIKELRQVSIDTCRGFTMGQYTPCSLWQ